MYLQKTLEFGSHYCQFYKNRVNLTVQKMESDNFSKKNGILSVLHTHFVSFSLSLTAS